MIFCARHITTTPSQAWRFEVAAKLTRSESAQMWPLNHSAAWRAAQAMRAIAPSIPRNVCPGTAAGYSRRGFMPQTQLASQRLRHEPAPPRSYGQRLELAEGILPRGLPHHCADKAVIFTLFRCTPTELPFSCCGSVATPRAPAWATRPSTCDAQRGNRRAPQSSVARLSRMPILIPIRFFQTNQRAL
jgi:hypothetical protein